MDLAEWAPLFRPTDLIAKQGFHVVFGEGGTGTICGAANVAPGWVVRIYDDFKRGDWDAARAHQDALFELVMAVRGGVFPAAIKTALHLLGV